MTKKFSGRVAIVAEHASFRFGGEAAIPLHYFQRLRAAGLPVWLVIHARTKDELTSMFPGEKRILFVPDTLIERTLWRIGSILPRRIAEFSTGYLMRLWSQIRQRRIVRRLVKEENITVVHQPIPVAPKEPSLMFGLGVPVVIGPLNGGMEYPPAFRSVEKTSERIFVQVARSVSHLVNQLVPGKPKAAAVIVANERSRQALPRGLRGQIFTLCENGIDAGLWTRTSMPARDTGSARPLRLLFMGRLVDWKGVDHLLEALSRVKTRRPVELMVLGDGPERARLEAHAVRLGLQGDRVAVDFVGWKTQAECAEFLAHADALVLPSLWECGGAVVLEAMASARAVIATNWGGPADYLDPTCGILVEPSSPEAFVEGIHNAIERLADTPGLVEELGARGREKVIRDYDWDRKIERMVAIYGMVVDEQRARDDTTSGRPRIDA